jgi:hypothetical protein
MEEHDELTEWVASVRAIRSDFPLGLVLARDSALLLEGFVLRGLRADVVVVQPSAAIVHPDSAAFAAIVQRTTTASIVAEWGRRAGREYDNDLKNAIFRLAFGAARGWSLRESLAGSGWHRRTLARRLRANGWPPPGQLMSQGRVIAFELRCRRGMSLDKAAALGGWGSRAAALRFARRYAGVTPDG